MSVALYLDENVHAAIFEGLVQRGIDVVTAQSDGRSGRDDYEIINRATELNRLLFTQDDDFLRIAAEYLRSGVTFSGVAFVRQQAATVRELIDDLEVVSKALTLEDTRNLVHYLPL